MGSTILVDEQDIINTYSKDEQFSCKKHFEYKKLIKKKSKAWLQKMCQAFGFSTGKNKVVAHQRKKESDSTCIKGSSKTQRS